MQKKEETLYLRELFNFCNKTYFNEEIVGISVEWGHDMALYLFRKIDLIILEMQAILYIGHRK